MTASVRATHVGSIGPARVHLSIRFTSYLLHMPLEQQARKSAEGIKDTETSDRLRVLAKKTDRAFETVGMEELLTSLSEESQWWRFMLVDPARAICRARFRVGPEVFTACVTGSISHLLEP